MAVLLLRGFEVFYKVLYQPAINNGLFWRMEYVQWVQIRLCSFKFCYSKASHRFFQNPPTHEKGQNDVLYANMNMDSTPYV